MSTVDLGSQRSKPAAAVVGRYDYCFTCHCAEHVSVSLWDVQTGTIRRTYSCSAGSSSRRSEGKAVTIALLGSSYLLCAPSAVPFIYVWSLTKASTFLKLIIYKKITFSHYYYTTHRKLFIELLDVRQCANYCKSEMCKNKDIHACFQDDATPYNVGERRIA